MGFHLDALHAVLCASCRVHHASDSRFIHAAIRASSQACSAISSLASVLRSTSVSNVSTLSAEPRSPSGWRVAGDRA